MSARDKQRIAELEATISRVRSLIPTQNPELIEAGYEVLAEDLLVALGPA